MAVSESGFERERAVALMISDYRSEYLDELVACARDVDVSVRRAVYRRIHETKDREFIAPLQEILNSASDIDDRKLLTEALARLRSLPVDTPVPQAPR
jgi:HEAT repeat protein